MISKLCVFYIKFEFLTVLLGHYNHPKEKFIFNESELQNILETEDFITGEKIMNAIRNFSNAIYIKNDFILKDGIWRNVKISKPKRKDIAGKVVVVGHSDYPFTAIKYLKLIQLGASRIVATNLEIDFKKIQLLPLGLTNHTYEPPGLDIRDSSILRKIAASVRRPDLEDEMKIYLNFNPNTFPIVRNRVLELANNNPGIKIGDWKVSKLAQVEFLKEIRTSHMVICPRGNGRDTHRFWETIYLGAVPIVVKSELPRRMLTDFNLPLVILDSWNELNDLTNISKLYTSLVAFNHESQQIQLSKLVHSIKG